MISGLKTCGCPEKFNTRNSENFSPPLCLNGIKSKKSRKLHHSHVNFDECIHPKSSNRYNEATKVNCNNCCVKASDSQVQSSEGDEEKKIISEIVETGMPYKEIEAIINNDRMIIRVQKSLPNQREWVPLCDCIPRNDQLKTQQKLNELQNSKDTDFRKKDSTDCGEKFCRTITIYPHADSDVNTKLDGTKSDQHDNGLEEVENDLKKCGGHKIMKEDHSRSVRTIDLEENPNIFLLRIKKKCRNEDGEFDIDLELRSPRPWLPGSGIQKPKSSVKSVKGENEVEVKWKRVNDSENEKNRGRGRK